MKTEFSEDEILLAIDSGEPDSIRKLIEVVGVNYRIQQENNDPLINFTISNAESQVFREVLSNKPDLELKNDLDETILHSAIYSGKLDRVKAVLIHNQLNMASDDGTTPLLLALGLKNDQIALFLIENGADVNMADDDGNRPLHLASFFGLSKVVDVLLRNGANTRVKTKKGNYPLALAINNDFYNIAKKLIHHHGGLL